MCDEVQLNYVELETHYKLMVSFHKSVDIVIDKIFQISHI